MASFDQFLPPDIIKDLHSEFLARTAPEGLYDVVDPNAFRSQAEEESAPYFDKSLDLAVKEINMAREQRKATKQQQEGFQKEDLGAFTGIQDRSFARTLFGAQYGFSSRGVGNSGFRRGNIEDLRQGNQDTLDTATREDRQTTATRNLDFSQFLDQSNLSEEKARLNIQRQREAEIMQRQGQLAQQKALQQQGAQSQFENSWEDFLGKLGA